MRIWVLSSAWTLVADIGAWLVIHLGVSYICFRLPDRWFERKTPIRGPKLVKSREEHSYERMGIRLWKDRLPEGSSFFQGSFSKKSLSSRDPNYYEKFILEANRGEWTHWLSMLPAPLFFLWNEPLYGWIIIGYALIANVPFIVVQRYNRLRLERIVTHFQSRV